MAFTMTDFMIAGILRCLGNSSLAVVLILLFVLPGVIAAQTTLPVIGVFHLLRR